MFDFLWSLRQDQRLGDHKAPSIRGEHNVDRLARELRRLEGRLETMHLVNMAMWAIMQKRLGTTDAELAEMVREIDLRDGALDGKITPRVSKCPACNRTMSERHARCLYCGHTELDLSQLDS